MKRALITGITGQDGSYLAEFLLEKGYEVHGIKRRSSLFNTQRVDHIYQDSNVENSQFKLHYGDLSDTSNLTRILRDIEPDEVYNLGAQSHVAVSFESPEYTADIDGVGTLRMLEAIRLLGLERKTKFYQASSSELYGLVQETPQTETTPFYPRSPYAVAKLYSYWICVNYREAYGIYACNGILFNHESPRRGETFVTRKITRGLANIALGLESCIYMGNIDALRDWGHAKDYVRMQWMMLQQDEARDYVIATGKQYSVREFITWSANALGIDIEFKGAGLDEVGIVTGISGDLAPKISVGQEIVRINPRYFRPAEVDTLLGDPSKAKAELGWEPEITAQEMCKEMVEEDHKAARRLALLKENDLELPVSTENLGLHMKKNIDAGHKGMVGSAICRQLQTQSGVEIITRTREKLDFCNQSMVQHFMKSERPDEIILAAAKVGGIHANNTYPAEFIYQNLQIQNNVIHAAHLNDVQKLLFLGSSCIYPKQVEQPMWEGALLTGMLEPTNEPYAIAKIAGIKLCESYNRQYGRDYRSVMPTNLYGPGDNYHSENSHVVPALIRRFHEAKESNLGEVTVWGTGTPKREFLYVDDMAQASLFIHNLDSAKYLANTKPMLSHINVGTGIDVTIKELAETIMEVVRFTGNLVFDTSKPDGTMRKLVNVERLDLLGYTAATSLRSGLELAYADFLENASTLRM